MLSAIMIRPFGLVKTRKDLYTVEAFITPFKYALFAIVGWATLRQTGHIDEPAISIRTCALCGLMGGIMLAILILMRLPAMAVADMDDQFSSNVLYDQLTLAVKEVISSAVATGTGGLTMCVTHRCTAQVTVVGAIGALISIVLSYALLGAALGILCLFLKYRGPRTQL
jgi:hypothetical protein